MPLTTTITRPPTSRPRLTGEPEAAPKVVHALELELQAVLIDVEHAGDAGVHVDGHVAQADGAVEVGVVEDGLLDHAGGVGEVDHPGLGAELLDLAHEVEDHRDGAEGLEHAAGTVGLLAEHAVGQRDALVEHAGGQAADADLGGHEVGAVEGGAAVGGEDHLGGQAGVLDHALREGAHGLELLLALGDVDEPQLVHGEVVVALDEALDELGRVARAAADRRDLDAVRHCGSLLFLKSETSHVHVKSQKKSKAVESPNA